ncbi:MAG: hypothetical protein M1812_006466 [Candelaria pacifica]|nr:MAG: hypothetical protein M1812_006466 [Candelaria pacifica]
MTTAEADSTTQDVTDTEMPLPSDEKQLALSLSPCSSRSGVFPKVWRRSIQDKNLALYGFRRFKTSHLVNLRFLEEEIATLDRRIYQVGLKLENDTLSRTQNRLGLRHSLRDSSVPSLEYAITDSMVLKMRSLLKEYDDALTSFNKLMAMETFSLVDDESQSRDRTDLHPYEMYKTRLVRVDLGTRSMHDPFRRGIQKALQRLQYWRMRNNSGTDEERGSTSRPSQDSKAASYQNTALVAGILSRTLVSLMAGIFMVLPLIMVSHQTTQKTRLTTISVWIVGFSLSISATLQASNLATVGVVAAYAAVLSVFVSNQ